MEAALVQSQKHCVTAKTQVEVDVTGAGQQRGHACPTEVAGSEFGEQQVEDHPKEIVDLEVGLQEVPENPAEPNASEVEEPLTEAETMCYASPVSSGSEDKSPCPDKSWIQPQERHFFHKTGTGRCQWTTAPEAQALGLACLQKNLQWKKNLQRQLAVQQRLQQKRNDQKQLALHLAVHQHLQQKRNEQKQLALHQRLNLQEKKQPFRFHMNAITSAVIGRILNIVAYFQAGEICKDSFSTENENVVVPKPKNGKNGIAIEIGIMTKIGGR